MMGLGVVFFVFIPLFFSLEVSFGFFIPFLFSLFSCVLLVLEHIYGSCFKVLCVPLGQFLLLAFLLFTDHIFILLHKSRNFLLDARHCKFTSLSVWILLSSFLER